MKKIALFLSMLVVVTAGFAEDFILENQTSYPSKKNESKIAIQWATTAKEVDENNKALIHGLKWDASTLQIVEKKGKIKFTIPEKAEHFRVLVWSKNEQEPDLVTNWVDIVPNKTYTLKTDHLVPVLLMSGSGC